jgi:hypothetical protein
VGLQAARSLTAGGDVGRLAIFISVGLAGPAGLAERSNKGGEKEKFPGWRSYRAHRKTTLQSYLRGAPPQIWWGARKISIGQGRQPRRDAWVDAVSGTLLEGSMPRRRQGRDKDGGRANKQNGVMTGLTNLVVISDRFILPLRGIQTSSYRILIRHGLICT